MESCVYGVLLHQDIAWCWSLLRCAGWLPCEVCRGQAVPPCVLYVVCVDCVYTTGLDVQHAQWWCARASPSAGGGVAVVVRVL